MLPIWHINLPLKQMISDNHYKLHQLKLLIFVHKKFLFQYAKKMRGYGSNGYLIVKGSKFKAKSAKRCSSVYLIW